MRSKNWIEFNNEETFKEDKISRNLEKQKRINIYTQKKGKKGKIITVIEGITSADKNTIKELLKKLKIFCGTGGTVNDDKIHLQGDLRIKVENFLRKEGFNI